MKRLKYKKDHPVQIIINDAIRDGRINEVLTKKSNFDYIVSYQKTAGGNGYVNRMEADVFTRKGKLDLI